MENADKLGNSIIWYSEAAKLLSTKELAGFTAAVFTTKEEWFRFIELLVTQNYLTAWERLSFQRCCHCRFLMCP